MSNTGKIITGAVISSVNNILKLYLSVRGAIDPADLGVTLTHEHLLLQFDKALQPPGYLSSTDLSDLEFTLENIGNIRQYP